VSVLPSFGSWPKINWLLWAGRQLPFCACHLLCVDMSIPHAEKHHPFSHFSICPSICPLPMPSGSLKIYDKANYSGLGEEEWPKWGGVTTKTQGKSLSNFCFNFGIASLRLVYLWNEGIWLPNEAFPFGLSTEISRHLFEAFPKLHSLLNIKISNSTEIDCILLMTVRELIWLSGISIFLCFQETLCWNQLTVMEKVLFLNVDKVHKHHLGCIYMEKIVRFGNDGSIKIF